MSTIRRYFRFPLLAACASIAACSSDPESPPPNLAGQLEADTGVKWTVYTDPRSHEVRFMAPERPVHIGAGTPEEKARAFFERYSAALHTSGKSDELRMVSSANDARGGTHVRFAHFLPGTDLPVFASGSTAHFTADGSVYWLQADFRADLADVDGNATVAKDAAIERAIAHVKSSCGAVVGQPTAGAADLGVLSDPDTHAALAYRVEVSVESEGCLAPSVLVDARSGSPLKIEERGHSIDATVGGSLFFRQKDFRDVKPISVTAVPGVRSRFQMITDDSPGARALTRDFGTGRVIESSDIAHWDERASSGQGAAADAHFHTRKALEFLRGFASGFQAHKREHVFPLSRDVDVFVHDNREANSDGFNAFASFDRTTNRDIIHFGDAPKVPNSLPFSAAYDVVAHELTHLVTEHTSQLKYERESGALNESFSDVMGAAAEHALFPDDKNNFLIGEKLFIPGLAGMTVLRSMSAPQSVSPPSPDHMDGKVPCPASGPTGGKGGNDACGVHSNSGIPNRAFALIVAGGAVSRFEKDKAPVIRPVGVEKGIGWERAVEITYWAATGLNATATFENAALAQIAEAAKLNDFEAGVAVTCAWHAVGVLKGTAEAEAALGATFCKPQPPAPPPPPGPMPVNFCEGRGDALVCDPAAGGLAVLCKNGVPAIPPADQFCADPTQRCKFVSADDLTAVTDANGVLVCE